jgi:Antirepressor regulating drug resistance, predicted signal transduction N-terminal membrane component
MLSMYLFNFLFNATFSLLTGMLVVGMILKLFKVQQDTWRLTLLSLPFVKVLYDLAQGIPEKSVLKLGLDPFTFPDNSRYFNLGFGWSNWGPRIQGFFILKGSNKEQYTASGSDLLYYYLKKQGFSAAITATVAIICAVSIFLLARRISNAWKFESIRRQDRSNSQLFKIQKIDFRKVEIYISQAFSGTPFTGGILNPYICIPSETFKNLSEAELKAVIAHEMGHVQKFDLLFTVAIQLLGDLLWFVPFYRGLSRKIDRLREIIADRYAIKTGASGAALASALIKLKEIPATREKFILYSAFMRESSLLKTRVEILLQDQDVKAGRLGWKIKLLRYVIVVWAAGMVMTSTLAGNHSIHISPPTGWYKAFLDFFDVNVTEFSED